MKKRWILVFLLTAAVGTGLHFLYDLLPSPITAVFAPVNESVWEHLKLLYWPMLLAGVILSRKSPDRKKLWSGIFGAILAMPVWLNGIYYLLKCGFGLEALWIDLILYYGTLAAGFLFAWRLMRRALPKWAPAALTVCVLAFGALLIYFTTFPPDLPIFISA